jgi:hypothetical protein
MKLGGALAPPVCHRHREILLSRSRGVPELLLELRVVNVAVAVPATNVAKAHTETE